AFDEKHQFSKKLGDKPKDFDEKYDISSKVEQVRSNEKVQCVCNKVTEFAYTGWSFLGQLVTETKQRVNEIESRKTIAHEENSPFSYEPESDGNFTQKSISLLGDFFLSFFFVFLSKVIRQIICFLKFKLVHIMSFLLKFNIYFHNIPQMQQITTLRGRNL
ncbi:hypothetical protein RFI_25057, partial [Reticulomyxa filosa]